MNIKQFNEIPDGAVMKTGTISNNPEGCNMSNSGELLRYVAKKGQANDWCVYIQSADWTEEQIKRNGDKVGGKVNILKCIEVDDDVFTRYRY